MEQRKEEDSNKEVQGNVRGLHKQEREVKKQIQVNPRGMFLLLQSSSHSSCSECDWSSHEIAQTLALSMLSEPVSVNNTASTAQSYPINS